MSNNLIPGPQSLSEDNCFLLHLILAQTWLTGWTGARDPKTAPVASKKLFPLKGEMGQSDFSEKTFLS